MTGDAEENIWTEEGDSNRSLVKSDEELIIGTGLPDIRMIKSWRMRFVEY